MEKIVKNPGLDLIIEIMLSYLDKSSIASFQLVNQDCRTIVDNPRIYLKKLPQLEEVPKDLIKKWKKILQKMHNASDTKQKLGLELFKMYCTNNAKYPLKLAYDHADEDKGNPELAMAILENSDHESFVKAKEPKHGNLRSIHLAACFCYVQTVEKIVTSSVTPNPPDEYGITPILLASQNGHIEVVKLLVAISDNIHLPSDMGQTPINKAAENGHLDILKILMTSTDNPNIADIEGETPIYVAAQNGHIDIVKLLMTLSDNPNAPANIGRSPIYVAASNGHLQIVKVLMASTNNPNTPDNNGQTPIFAAARNGHLSIV